MTPGRKLRKERDWYKVSVETLRGWGIFVLLVSVAGVGYAGFRVWERYAVQREAAQAIDESRVLFQQLRGEQGLAAMRTEYESAWEGIEQARALFSQARYDDALGSAARSRDLLLSLLDASRSSRDSGEAQFIAVQGRVEFRRADRGDWEQARGRVMLRPGDYVKTGESGSAEIMFADGTLYTVRPKTLFLVSGRSAGGEQQGSVELQYGWINLNTAQTASRVATPQAEAVIADQSEAEVSYDGERREASFTAYRGAMRVAAGGEVRELGALQTVRQAAGRLSDVLGLPAAPRLLAPAENADIDLDAQKELALAWEEVSGGERYALQISRNRLFVDNVIDVEDRRSADATLGLQGEGSFLWRVAAISPEQLRGPWSPAGRFRVASSKGSGGGGDEEPPPLEVDSVQPYGSIFIVSGRTEPGASVWVNGESVTVEADGSFTKTIQLAQSGWAFLEVRATDAWGNETSRRERVFVESL